MRNLLKLAIAILIILGLSQGVWADVTRVISYGADLSENQRNQVFQMFGLSPADREQILTTEVTNQEERQYLEGLVMPALIGTRAISSAYVELLGENQGITVETRNITWVTPEMYANALTTANVTDARVIAAAPFPVSGTAALTGIFKAFEAATGRTLKREAKDVANEEMVRTGEIAQSIGDPARATELIIRIKEEVVRQGLTDPAEIRQVVINISNQLNINLTPEQIEQLIVLMRRLGGLNLNIGQINTQLQDIRTQLNQLVGQGEEIRGLLQRIIDFIMQLLTGMISLFGK